MKICILKESLCLGGTERSAANISRVLAKKHDVTVALFNGTKVEYPYGGRLFDFGCPPAPGRVGKVLSTLRRVQKYKSLLQKERVDLTFEFLSVNCPLSTMRHKVPHRIISCRDFSGMKLYHAKFHKALENADAMVCNSEYLKDYYLSLYPAHQGKVFTVYNVIDTDVITESARGDCDPNFLRFVGTHSKTVVSTGRFCREKGFEHLLTAFAKAQDVISDIGLVLVGDGELRPQYEALIERLRLQDHVYLTGFQKNPYQYMARADVFLLSSLSEGFPNVLAEAMALGLPVIAANCLSGPAEILRRDQSYDAVTDRFAECDFGILTPRLDTADPRRAEEELTAALLHLLTDDDLMRRYSEAARLRAADFSPEAAADKLEEIFTRLKGEKAP